MLNSLRDMIYSTIDLLFDLIKKSSLCILAQIVLSSEIIHNILRILSFIDFNVLNICTIVELNFQNVLGFWFPFVHVSPLILIIELRFGIEKSFVFRFVLISSFWGNLALSIVSSEISRSLFLVLFTLSNLVSCRNFWAKRSLETVINSISWIYIICALSHSNWRYWLSFSIQKGWNFLCLLRLLISWWKNSLLDWNLLHILSRLLGVNSRCLILWFRLVLNRSLVSDFLSNGGFWNDGPLYCLILRGLNCVGWGHHSLSLRNICISSGRSY